MKEEKIVKHVNSHVRCLVAHLDGDKNLLPGCIQCRECGEFIRPEDMGKQCSGKAPPRRNCWIGGKIPIHGDLTIFDTGLETAWHPSSAGECVA